MFAGASLHSIIREAYLLSKHVNISISESHELPDFEREIYINMLAEDIKNENEIIGGK